MTKKLRLMMTMLLLAVMGSVWAEDVTFDFQQNTNAYGWEGAPANSSDLSVGDCFTNEYVTITYTDKGSGSTNLRWWSTGDGLRSYKGNKFLIATSEGEIEKISIQGTCVLEETSSTGGTISNSRNWTAPETGGVTSVEFLCNQSSGAKNIKKVVVTIKTTNTPPSISANNISLAYDATMGEIPYTISNPVENESLTATSTDEWISNIVVGADKVTFTTTQNNGDADRTGTITLSYNGATDKEITVTQGHFVIDYATLPFNFNGKRANIQDATGLKHTGLGTDYTSEPYLKFDTADDNLVLKFNETPGILTFDIKGNGTGTWSGTFNVETSENGIDWVLLDQYTSLSGVTETKEYNILNEGVRYIRWYFKTKTSGFNVGLGNIVLTGVEAIEFATDGYKTYVTENPIDWEATLERNNTNVDVHGYKAIVFSESDGVSLVEFGKENQSSVAETDPTYQEPITPAETPMIIMGKQGKNYLVISSVTTANAPKGNLFRKGGDGATTTLKEDGEPDVALYVMQKIDVNGSGIDNYKFYRLRPGYTVPEGKAYLSSENITVDPQTPPNVNNIKSSYPMRVLEQEDEQLVSEDAGIVDGIGMNYQEGKDNIYYNVNGMRIANPSKGIYIVNGRKVVLK